jgi:WD40 repeat protein
MEHQRKLALLVGCSIYNDFPPLRKAEADVYALAEVLREPSIGNFDVIMLLNEPVERVKQEIGLFFLRQTTTSDLLLLYFSGHGALTDKTENLYIPGKDTESDLLASTAITSSFLKNIMEESPSKRQVLILDCCYSGAFIGMKGSSQFGKESIKAFEGRGRAVFTASGAAEIAWTGDEEKPLSLFTHYLVHGLKTGEADRDRDGFITLDEWYDYTYDGVVRDSSSKRKQTPSKSILNQQGPPIIIANNPIPLIEERLLQPQVQNIGNDVDTTRNPFPTSSTDNLIEPQKRRGPKWLLTPTSDDLVQSQDTTNAPIEVLTSPPPLSKAKELVLLRTLVGHYPIHLDKSIISANGQILVSHCYGGVLQVWNLYTGKLLYVLGEELHKGIRAALGEDPSLLALALSSDGQTLVTNWSDKKTRVWSLESGVLLSQTNKGPHLDDYVEPNTFSMSADGQILATSAFWPLWNKKTIEVWDIQRNNLLYSLKKHTDHVIYIAISPNRQLLASADKAGIIRMWNLQNGTELSPLTGLESSTSPITFSHDGKLFAAYSPKTKKITDEKVITQYSHIKDINNHNYLAKQIKIWDPYTGTLLHTLETPPSDTTYTSPIELAAFDQDDQALVGISSQFFYAWDIQSEMLIRSGYNGTDLRGFSNPRHKDRQSRYRKLFIVGNRLFILESHDQQAVEVWMGR